MKPGVSILATLRKNYGYRMFTGKHAQAVKAWLAEQAEASRSSEDLVRAPRGGVSPPTDYPARHIDH